jgi:hypothetical protein
VAALTAPGERVINLDDLERAVAAADANAYLFPRRLLRRVIRRDRGVVILGRAARQSTYVIAGTKLAAIVRPEEVSPTAARGPWPATVLLLQRPAPEDLASLPPRVLLAIAWRRLFRARVQAEIRRKNDAGAIDADGLAERIARIGRTEFEEAGLVFQQDGWLLPPGSEAEVYVLFAAHFLELSAFAPALIHPTFPAVEAPATLTAVFAGDVAATAVLAATRPRGAPDPALVAPASLADDGFDADAEVEPEGDDERAPELEGPAARDRSLSARARAQADRGNLVRAAVLWTRAAAMAGGEPGSGSRSRSAARSALRRLARRLRAVLGFGEREVEAWTRAMSALLPHAAREFWAPEARLLYDLQRVCLDHERESYRIDLLTWLLSMGRRPLRTPLPYVREVLVSSRLRSAVRRLPRVRLARGERARLEALLRPAVHRAELALRQRFRPGIAATLGSTWVAPGNLPERVALAKLIEDLLDQIVSRGHLTLSDLRDAASRSDLKLPDLSSPGEFWRGGRLLVADRALGRAFDGVHRRGEVYLRWLQRFSMLAFGTSAGRLFTLFVALPYGGAYVVLEGLQHLVALTGAHPRMVNAGSLLTVGTVVLSVVNYVRFRRQLIATLRRIGRVLRRVVVDLPRRIVDHPAVQSLLHSPVAGWAWRFALKPSLAAAPAWGLARLCGGERELAFVVAAGTFVGTSFVLNTRAGRVLEDVVLDAVVRGWRWAVLDVVPGVFRLVMGLFKRVVEAVERVFYAVDQWLRFRGGQSRWSLVAKAIAGPLWAAVAYLGRAGLNVLVEPQLNPIKHFPVVTVSHKIIFPMTPLFVAAFTPFFGPVDAKLVAGTVVLLLPGMFGFLVWELKSNWRMYEANRPATLQPVAVGGHGETVVRLLRPGFHSGTLPKAFARFRRARRRVWTGPDVPRPEKAAQKQREALHHTEEALRRFVERDLLALLAGSRALGGPGSAVVLGEVRLATNRIRLELLPPGVHEAEPLGVDIEERGKVLVGGVWQTGWLDTISPDARQTLDTALTGWFLKSGVALVQTPGSPVGDDGNGASPPQTAPRRLAEVEVTWSKWVEAWAVEEAGQRLSAPLAGVAGVLPRGETTQETRPVRPRRRGQDAPSTSAG